MFEKLGQCVFKLQEKWKDSERDDIIQFNPAEDEEELHKNFKIGAAVETRIKDRILDIVRKYWDCFCSKGARRPILGYEFSINTGTHSPVCKFPAFGGSMPCQLFDSKTCQLSDNCV